MSCEVKKKEKLLMGWKQMAVVRTQKFFI